MNYFNNFIIIDDDRVNNALCTKIIEDIYPKATIRDFIDAQKGLDHISEKYASPDGNKKAILLLDIMMPEMDAWDFLAAFDKMEQAVKDSVKIYILSSSVDKADMSRAQSNQYVEYYLIKPLNKESIRLMVHVLHKRLGLSDR
jgi:response regulator RpfG family c-di-GMP phosphodiesterase